MCLCSCCQVLQCLCVCGQTVMNDPATHLTVCSERCIACAHCGTKVPHKEHKAHVEQCPERAVECPFCSALVKQAALGAHTLSCMRNTFRCRQCTTRGTLLVRVKGQNLCIHTVRYCQYCQKPVHRLRKSAHEVCVPVPTCQAKGHQT